MSGTSRFEERPWGTFEVLADGFSHSKVKYITVLPGKRLSYQSHEHRAEHWIVVEGTAVVTLNDEIIELSVGDFIDVPRGARHRCSNPGGEPLTFVEVQLGDYFGEDDIVRYDDDFGRTT